MTVDVLSDRALNRATLERQLLLRRSPMALVEAVEHLVGLQAQLPLDPYTALSARLARFRPTALGRLVDDRALVRIVVMRGTIHLFSAADCLVLRPLAQPVLDREIELHRELGPKLVGVDLTPVLAFVSALVGARPRSGPELRAELAARFPDLDPAALVLACRNHLAFIQVPPRGVWGRTAQVTYATAEAWLGRPVAERPSLDDVVLRYFAAFGPAAVADVAAWSRLTGLAAVVDRLRPRLRPFRDERGRELFDGPDAPRPDAAVPAPPRFLPEFDNLLLSHADRRRFGPDADRRALRHPPSAHPPRGWFLVDGAAAGRWTLERDRDADRAVLRLDPLRPPRPAQARAVEAEGRRLLALLAADAGRTDVRWVMPD